MDKTSVLLTLISSVVNLVHADFQCVCNHHTEREVYSSPSKTTMPLAFVYKDECRALVWVPNLDSRWLAIQFFHTIAYIQTDSGIDIATCKGQIPDEDKASTMFPPPTGTTTLSSGTTAQSPSTVPNTQVTSQHHYSSHKTTTHQQPYQTSGLDTSTIQSTTKSPMPSSTAVSSRPTTLTPVLKGHTEYCPNNVIRGAHFNGFLLAQYHHSCFEVCNSRVSWSHAESLCEIRGGHLATIHDIHENNYLHNFIRSHLGNTAVWIGLNDRSNEGHFHWTSGEPVHFKNWSHNRNNPQHLNRDCAVMQADGTWDDHNCGSDFIFTEIMQARFPYVCAYGVHVGAALIG